MKRSVPALALCAALAACGSDAPEDSAAPAAPPPTADAAAPAAPAPAAPADGALVNPNEASREELAAVPGLNPELAAALVQGRPHADMRAVDAVLARSLGEPEREAVYRHLWIPLDLNTASPEEIELIPGVGGRMRHEFEEYRPYRGIEQFRREIGKYVNDAEVARLERYVTIRG